MEHKGRFIVRLFSLFVVLIVIGAVVAYGYRWHSQKLDEAQSACSQKELETQQTQAKQDQCMDRLLKQFQMDSKEFNPKSYSGGRRFYLLDGTGMYYEARNGSEEITVKFTDVISPASK